jgi:hypothetical protein
VFGERDSKIAVSDRTRLNQALTELLSHNVSAPTLDA